MNSFLGKIQGKLQEARISDVNHELGKVKESLVTESSAYWNSFRSEAASVGSLIRSESTRFSQLLGRQQQQRQHSQEEERDYYDDDDDLCVKKPYSSVPKSVSLPAIAPNANLKYKYKSSACGEAALNAEYEEAADDFIRVLEKKVEGVEAQDGAVVEDNSKFEPETSRRVTHRAAASTREEIRRKLALFADEESQEEQEKKAEKATADLEVCFINQAVAEDEEDEYNSSCAYKDKEEDSSEDEEREAAAVFPRSKDEWNTLRGAANSSGIADEELDEEQARTALRRRLAKLHKELRVNLSDCKSIARAHVEKEKLKRQREDPLAKLVGFAKHQVSENRLQQCGVAALQVVAEHFHSEIERLNEELVQLLIAKDELEIEQDSQLLDVEDLTHSIGNNAA